jgi:large subunit ribosomal protein L18e
LFRFLHRRTGSNFTKTILRRLVASRTNRPPLSLSKLLKHLGSKQERTAVIVGTVTDDKRVLDMPKVTVAALRFTETARARIVKAGGRCLTLDEMIMQTPSGKLSSIFPSECAIRTNLLGKSECFPSWFWTCLLQC